MHDQLSHTSPVVVNVGGETSELLNRFSIPFLLNANVWSQLSPECRSEIIRVAIKADYTDTPRGYETALVTPRKGE